MPKHTTVDGYISTFPAEVQAILSQLRTVILTAMPDASESISYQMPAVSLDGRPVVYYAAWKYHIGLYPVPRLEGALELEVAPYRATKDTLRLPYKQPIPYELIGRLVPVLVQMRSQ